MKTNLICILVLIVLLACVEASKKLLSNHGDDGSREVIEFVELILGVLLFGFGFWFVYCILVP